MSKFYGTLDSDKGVTTRAGHTYIRATAQSWEGSASVTLEADGDGKVWLALHVGHGSTSCPISLVWRKSLGSLLAKVKV